jgi:hypothetical protein
MNRKCLFWSIVAAMFGWLIYQIISSPFKKYDDHFGREIRVTTQIHAPAAQVFRYLGDSRNAAKWSSFVHHITPLNPTEKADGTVGAFRRCFKNADESGEVWDEEILEIEPNLRRKISIFNLQNFGFSVGNLRTEQRYISLDSTNCQLTFSLFFEPKKSAFFDEMRGILTGKQIQKIFQRNLANIKKWNEMEIELVK